MTNTISAAHGGKVSIRLASLSLNLPQGTILTIRATIGSR
jgi:hypothetical protein